MTPGAGGPTWRPVKLGGGGSPCKFEGHPRFVGVAKPPFLPLTSGELPSPPTLRAGPSVGPSRLSSARGLSLGSVRPRFLEGEGRRPGVAARHLWQGRAGGSKSRPTGADSGAPLRPRGAPCPVTLAQAAAWGCCAPSPPGSDYAPPPPAPWGTRALGPASELCCGDAGTARLLSSRKCPAGEATLLR